MIAPQNRVVGEPDSSLHDLEQGTNIEAALSFYDSLRPVTVEELIGAWKSAGIPTGDQLDGLLESLGHDAFRKVDDDTMPGALHLRGLDQPFMFILRRETAAQGVR